MHDRKYKIIIVDDEPNAIDVIRYALEPDHELEITGEYDDALMAKKAILELKPDILFLDIQMPKLNGIQLLKEIGTDHVPSVIFVTAYDKYAIRAFEVHALDYLLKPFSDDRLLKALDRAKKQVQSSKLQQPKLDKFLQEFEDFMSKIDNVVSGNAALESNLPGYKSRITVKSANKVSFINVNEIDWIEAASSYLYLHCDNQSHLLRQSMDSMELQLDPAKFARIHRSTIVNIDRISELVPGTYGDFKVVLNDGTHLNLSRSRKERLMKHFAN